MTGRRPRGSPAHQRYQSETARYFFTQKALALLVARIALAITDDIAQSRPTASLNIEAYQISAASNHRKPALAPEIKRRDGGVARGASSLSRAIRAYHQAASWRVAEAPLIIFQNIKNAGNGKNRKAFISEIVNQGTLERHQALRPQAHLCIEARGKNGI